MEIAEFSNGVIDFGTLWCPHEAIYSYIDSAYMHFERDMTMQEDEWFSKITAATGQHIFELILPGLWIFYSS